MLAHETPSYFTKDFPEGKEPLGLAPAQRIEGEQEVRFRECKYEYQIQRQGHSEWELEPGVRNPECLEEKRKTLLHWIKETL